MDWQLAYKGQLGILRATMIHEVESAATAISSCFSPLPNLSLAAYRHPRYSRLKETGLLEL
jgi:hypothetical protein